MEELIAGPNLISLVRLCYAANRPLLLIGLHGIGKSELLEQAAHAIGIEYIARDLSLMEAVDLSGLPKAVNGSTTYLPPKWLPRSGKGLLVFEELNRCEPQVRVPTLQLLTARCLNDYRLPPGWLPLASVNPPAEGYEVDELDPALLGRFSSVRLVPDRKEWLRWAGGAGVHPAVIRYIESDPTVFDKRESNPRSWKYVSDLVHGFDRLDIDLSTLRTSVLGQVGDLRGAAFMTTLKDWQRPLGAQDLLHHYSSHRSVVRKWIEQGRMDLVDSSLFNLLAHLQAPEHFNAARSDKSAWCNLKSFLGDLPGDKQEEAREHFDGREYEFPLKNVKRKRGKQ